MLGVTSRTSIRRISAVTLAYQLDNFLDLPRSPTQTYQVIFLWELHQLPAPFAQQHQHQHQQQPHLQPSGRKPITMASLLPLRRAPTSLLSSTSKQSTLLVRSLRASTTIPSTRTFTTRSSTLLPNTITKRTTITPISRPHHHLLISSTSIRQKSTKDNDAPTFRQWGFEDINASLPNSPTEKPIILIDVREPAELSSTGIIPSAVSVPLASQPDALFLTPEEFETRFGFPKPGVKGDEEGAEIVFYCKAGVRARAAAQLAEQAGYEASRLGVYDGSWLDWAKKGGRVERWEGNDN
ncbi:hypothetical protein CBS147320_6971 [Aspergillus niger]|nr:hypothetical protein CBS133816_3932 [Aspergillus niger]KAI2846565.1 hypothetical protein CBS11350_3598 [Aspergillus niger]KAI2866402.1 hypothetical protein CBS12448_1126 [Aspergillus niger]KAI2923771.1 hypothetical protein CBS147320_6971 [Aspergillus niger]KAI2976212.1 hypothetical protein CBS147324_2612 [Aspergillus niger]